MKPNKVTLLVLMAALLVPMTLSARTKLAKKVNAFSNTTEKVSFAKRGDATMPMPFKPSGNVQMLAMPKAEGDVLTWDFEDADAGLSAFTLDDKDGDGFNWEYYNNTGLETGLMTAHDGDGLIASASYDNDSSSALTPNNWLISPEVTLGGSLSFYAMGQDEDWCDEVFGVYVIIDGTATQVGVDKTATGSYELYEYDLRAYAGQTGQFAIVHHNVSDMFLLNIDDISYDPNGVVSPEPGLPTDLTAEPTDVTANLAWVAGENNGSWNLRYRPYVDPALIGADFSNMNADNYMEIASQFSFVDADGDGNNWGFAYADTGNYNVCFYSESYSSTFGALSPDNWLITPEVGQGTLSFKTWNSSGSYRDKIAVYVAPAGATTADFVMISDGDIDPGVSPEEYTFDLAGVLGDYTGTVEVAFRHYNSEDKWGISVSDIKITIPGAPEVQDWVVIEDVTNPYLLEGLTPETEYEYQVMAFNEAGDKNTEWTASTRFTTLKSTAITITVTPEFGTYTEAQTVFVNVENMPENGVIVYQFIPTPTRAISTYDPWTGIAITESGELTIMVLENGNTVAKLSGNYIIDSQTAISNISTDNADNTWYNLQGVKLGGKPVAPGIYINGGRKVVVK